MSAASPGSSSTCSPQYQEQGADYMVALLTGYADAPKDQQAPPGTFYNKLFPGPLPGDAAAAHRRPHRLHRRHRADAHVDQLARDVTAFLAWAAEPHLEARKRIGLQVMIFLIVFAGLLYFTKKKVWKSVEVHR